MENFEVRSSDDAGVLYGTLPIDPETAIVGSWHWFQIPDQDQVGFSLREWAQLSAEDATKLEFSLAFMGNVSIEKLRKIPGFVEKLDETNYTVPEETPDVGTGTSN